MQAKYMPTAALNSTATTQKLTWAQEAAYGWAKESSGHQAPDARVPFTFARRLPDAATTTRLAVVWKLSGMETLDLPTLGQMEACLFFSSAAHTQNLVYLSS